MAILVANNATSYLAGTLTAVATSLTVSSGTGTIFPTLSGGDVFYVTLTNASNQNEIVSVTAKATDTFTIVRAQDGTSALPFAIGDKVELRVIKVVFDDKASLTNNQTFSGLNTFTTPSLITPIIGSAGFTLNGSTSGTTVVKANATAGGWTLTLPSSAGTVNYVLSTDGSGNTSWVVQSGGGGAEGGGTDEIFYENDQTVTTSYAISNNKNAGTFGPITISSSATVTVPSGSTWSIV